MHECMHEYMHECMLAHKGSLLILKIDRDLAILRAAWHASLNYDVTRRSRGTELRRKPCFLCGALAAVP